MTNSVEIYGEMLFLFALFCTAKNKIYFDLFIYVLKEIKLNKENQLGTRYGVFKTTPFDT